MNLTFTLEGLDELNREWRGPGLGAIVRGCVNGVEDAVKEAVEHAKTHHPWQNRTGNLERSIAGNVAAGADITSAGGEVEGELVATEEYASFLEYGTSRARPYPFMVPAIEKAELTIIRGIDRGEDAAADIMNRG